MQLEVRHPATARAQRRTGMVAGRAAGRVDGRAGGWVRAVTESLSLQDAGREIGVSAVAVGRGRRVLARTHLVDALTGRHRPRQRRHPSADVRPCVDIRHSGKSQC